MTAKKSSTSRVASSAKKKTFKFRPWMAIVLVLIVAIVGIAILRSSHAFGGGKIYINGGDEGPFVEYDFNIDGSVNLKESITNKERRNVPFTQARAVGLQMVQEALAAAGQGGANIDPANLPPSVTQQIDSASSQQPAAPAATPAPATTPTPAAQTPATTTPAQTTDGSTPGGVSSAGVAQPTAKTYPVIGVSELKLPASITASATTVVYQVDGTTVATVKKSPFALNLNSTKYENGSHLLQAMVENKDGSKHTYIYAIDVQNKKDFWNQFLERLTGIFG